MVLSDAAGSILIVDDEQINVALFSAQLKDVFSSILTASSGEEALRVIETQQPDIILLDVMMPGMSGFEVATKLKADSRTRHIPIIIVTALTDSASCLKALECGAEEFLTKPVQRAELLMRARNLLKLKKYQDFLARHGADLEEQLAVGSLQLSQAQEKLVQSDKLASIGQLAAGVAHEINNPIGFVKSNVGSLKVYIDDILEVLRCYEAIEPLLPADADPVRQLQQAKAAADLAFVRDDIQHLIAQSQEGIARVAKIIQDLKNFARSDTNPAWVSADLRGCLDSALNIATNEIKYRADVVREYGELPEIECIPSQLAQVFLNILVNAAQAVGDTGKRGTITVRSGCNAADKVWIEVQDTGCGMTAEQARRVFEPFYTTKPVGVGTGLGLSISYGIVATHGGSIEVASEPGQGTRFRVTLPVRQSVDPAGSAA